MSILTALYNLIIGPLELLFEVVFSLSSRVIDHPGLSIILLSLAVNFLVLPLYKQADAMQAEERDTEEKLRPWVTHIKKTFKGDERFMILQTYYRQNHYKPTNALKGSLSLLLEIPFFMAAYNFLSELQLLNGVSFGPIQDLGAPDEMLVIAGCTIHVLPILMTAINLISGYIYTKGFPLKSKIQLYAMALIFLVFLYESPSGLVFYWTLNNLFSLFKNIFYKLKNPKFVLGILSSVVSAFAIAFIMFVHPMSSTRKQVLVVACLLLLQLPLVLYFAKKRFNTVKTLEATKKDKILFFSGSIFMTLFTGAFIPSAIIHASPAEFINVVTHNNPLLYILNSLLLAAGTFLVWFGIFYMLAKPSGKKLMGFGMWILSGIAVVNYMFFGTNYGNLSPQLKYDIYPTFYLKDQLLNMLVLVLVVAVFYLIWKKRAELIRIVYLAAGLAVLGMSLFNVKEIHDVAVDTLANLQNNAQKYASIPLSKNGQNVVVIMMDRAVNGYIPYIFQEKPELKEQFAGFTYYPNTISYGGFTNVGTPALYGGYEYTPTEMNKRSDEPLVDKQDEALKVMPVIFNQEGYEVTVCDPTYAGYDWIPDLSIYDDYPDINTYITMGKFDNCSEEKLVAAEKTLNRNFFCFSMFKIAPVFSQPFVYAKGTYNDVDALHNVSSFDQGFQIQDGVSKAVGISSLFTRSYNVLKNLPQMTELQDGNENTFMMISNDTTHEPTLLKAPEYEPADVVDNTAYDEAHKDRLIFDGRELKMNEEMQAAHYHVNMAAMIQLGNWLDYLRQNDVYDNTRIIIVSDHGRALNQFADMRFGEKSSEDAMFFNPLLLVKDFNAKEFTTDRQFMTNADVPTLATSGLIEAPVNPFTDKPIVNDAKTQSEQYILYSSNWDINVNNGNTFMYDAWYSVHDDIFDMDNWKILK